MSSAWQPLQQPADCLCVVSGHFLLGIVHTRQLLIRFPLVLVLRLFNTCGSLCSLCFSFCIMSRYLQSFFITDDGHCTTIIRSWPASCSTLVSYHRYCQHNGWWLLTTGYDRRTLSITAVVWRQSQTGRRIKIWACFYLKPECLTRGRQGRIWMRQ